MLFQIIINCIFKKHNESNFGHFFESTNFSFMESIQIFLRIKDFDELKEISLSALPYPVNDRSENPDTLWESTGEYFLEAYQCGTNPNICSIEKDRRILNGKEEIALMIMDEVKKTQKVRITGT